MALANHHVIADAGLPGDLAQLTLGIFEHEQPSTGHQRLVSELRIVQLQNYAFTRVHVDELGRVRRALRRQQDLVAPRLLDAARPRLEREIALSERTHNVLTEVRIAV